MKCALPALLAVVLTAAMPAMAEPGHGRGGGGWRGGGAPRGAPYGGGGRWSGGPGGPGGPAPPAEGRWNGGYPGGPESGPYYASPPGGRGGYPYYRGEQDQAREGVRSGQIKSMGWIIGRLERTHGGKMLDAQLEPGPNGRSVYRVIWAGANGRRSDFIIDAQTGAILPGY